MGLADMHRDYIDLKKEIRDINMEFRAQYESGISAFVNTDDTFIREW